MTMKSDNKRSSSDETGSGSAMTAQNEGLARVLRPARVDLAHHNLPGWDFRDLAVFLRAQDDEWVQHTGA